MMTVDHEVRSGDDNAARTEGIARFVIMFAIHLSGTGEAVDAR